MDLPYEQNFVPHQQKDITIKNLEMSFLKLYPDRNTLEVTVSMPYNNLLPLAGFPTKFTVPHISCSGTNAVFPIISLSL